MPNFHILPKQESGLAVPDENIKTWYVMEDGFEHFRCSNPTEANELLAGIKKYKSTEAERKTQLETPDLFQWAQDSRIAVMGNVAKKVAIENGLKKVSGERILPPLNPEHTSSDRLNLKSEHGESQVQATTNEQKKSKLLPP